MAGMSVLPEGQSSALELGGSSDNCSTVVSIAESMSPRVHDKRQRSWTGATGDLLLPTAQAQLASASATHDVSCDTPHMPCAGFQASRPLLCDLHRARGEGGHVRAFAGMHVTDTTRDSKVAKAS